MKKQYFFLAVLGVVLVVRWVPTNRITVSNESGHPAHALNIEVCDQMIDCGDLQPGESKTFWFGTPKQEDNLMIRCRLKDGTVIGDVCGYVVWEDYFSSSVVIICPDGGVKQKQ